MRERRRLSEGYLRVRHCNDETGYRLAGIFLPVTLYMVGRCEKEIRKKEKKKIRKRKGKRQGESRRELTGRE